jgi:hypothetical protein
MFFSVIERHSGIFHVTFINPGMNIAVELWSVPVSYSGVHGFDFQILELTVAARYKA